MMTAEKKSVLKEKKVEKRRIVLEGSIGNDGDNKVNVEVKKERKKKG